jgi:toxin-antitoxin system PIN domain toxin
MLSFDTNLIVYASNSAAPECAPARAFLESLRKREDVVVCELMLVEVYLKLRNPRILSQPLSAPEAAAYCRALRRHARWMLVDAGPVMDEFWNLAARPDFATRRIVDARLALTLLHHGVTEFATSNTKDFQGLGFKKVWNPLLEPLG